MQRRLVGEVVIVRRGFDVEGLARVVAAACLFREHPVLVCSVHSPFLCLATRVLERLRSRALVRMLGEEVEADPKDLVPILKGYIGTLVVDQCVSAKTWIDPEVEEVDVLLYLGMVEAVLLVLGCLDHLGQPMDKRILDAKLSQLMSRVGQYVSDLPGGGGRTEAPF